MLNRDLKNYLDALGFAESSAFSQRLVSVTETGERNTPSVSLLESNEARISLEELREQALVCQQCRLCEARQTVVFGEGNPEARLMFIGEGPGADEDAQGRPFVGQAGMLLTKMIEAMGLKRQDVYIANVVKCRPPQNRNPEPDEIEFCQPFLKQQIECVRPEVLVCLGKFAAQTVLETAAPISSLRGKFSPYPHLQSGNGGGIPVMPTFHPAYLLRNPSEKKVVWEDLQKVMKFLTQEKS